MHQYILITILSIALFFTIDNPAHAVSSGRGENSVSSGKSAFVAHQINNIHVNHYFNLNAVPNWPKEVKKFYSNRNYRLGWFVKGTLSQNAEKLIEALKNAPKEGFPDNYYQSLPLSDAYTEMKNNRGLMNFFPYKIVELDILFTQTYLKYASELSSGFLKPQELDSAWQAYSPNQNLVSNLEKSIETKKIIQSLRKLKPEDSQYNSLKEAREKLVKQKLKGGWPLPGKITKLKENDTSDNVVKIKKYLFATGDLIYGDSTYLHNPVFDDRLAEAVRHFQGRHGLKADGIAGNNTIREMNHTIDYRLGQIRVNLDRLRWKNENPHKKYIEINIPEYVLKYHKNGKIVQQMNVVVGETENSTPALKDTISSIVINPTWNVPRSIATEEMLPKIKADPGYLASHNYTLRSGSYNGEKVTNPQAVEWSEITKNNFPFFIVQEPGNFNSLGRIKFMLPNNYSIYLHDTPATHLFNRAQRDFSHGCIRLEKPFELAYTLLEEQLTPAEIREKLDSQKTETVLLREKVPVHIHYHTAWVDSAGQMQFRNDVYELDKISLAALNK